MKHFLIIAISVLGIGIAKANYKKDTESLPTQKTFTVYSINAQKTYAVAFKFFPQKRFIYGPAPKVPEFQNKLMIENLRRVASRHYFQLRRIQG